MVSLRRPLAVVAFWIACLTAVAPARAQSSELGKDLAIYLGCGEVKGPGKVFQLDSGGKVLGVVELPATPYGIAAHKGGLVVAVWSSGSVMKIDTKGKSETLFQDRRLLIAPIAIAVTPGSSGDILVADNRMDVLMFLRGAQGMERRMMLRKRSSQLLRLQDMSVALTKDGYVLFSTGSDLDLGAGVYRFRPGPNAALGTALLETPPRMGMWYARVAADPSSGRWVALTMSPPKVAGTLRVFKGTREGTRELKKLRCPIQNIAFGPTGTLFAASGRYDRLARRWCFEVGIVNLKRKEDAFRKLFAWKGPRLVSMAVAKKMPWPKK